ncbi:hypothetical protein GRF29_8g2582156 [Pseudopithomyces chartarum]|uniref:Uncharacterized protein n=1 Tax=Pseudopithomyces chartarum TaxID=1892770 RepID=A0AAN6M8K1_9PLEO|nr:hypothetical protein GRF29_8g2582156 [Pseudopithomyces chartarum]
MRQSHAINVFFKEVFSQCELYAQSKPGAAPYGFNFWIEPDLASKLCNTLATKSMLSTAVSFQELAAHQLSERILSLFFAWINAVASAPENAEWFRVDGISLQKINSQARESWIEPTKILQNMRMADEIFMRRSIEQHLNTPVWDFPGGSVGDLVKLGIEVLSLYLDHHGPTEMGIYYALNPFSTHVLPTPVKAILEHDEGISMNEERRKTERDILAFHTVNRISELVSRLAARPGFEQLHSQPCGKSVLSFGKPLLKLLQSTLRGQFLESFQNAVEIKFRSIESTHVFQLQNRHRGTIECLPNILHSYCTQEFKNIGQDSLLTLLEVWSRKIEGKVPLNNTENMPRDMEVESATLAATMLTTYLQDDDIRSYFRFKAFAKTPNQNAINMVTRKTPGSGQLAS